MGWLLVAVIESCRPRAFLMENTLTFSDLGLSESTLEAVTKKGFLEPSEIQALTIPVLLRGDRDVIGQAQTGTGKTAAFGLPIIDRIQEKAGHVQAVILTPTRELALQVSEELISLKGDKKLFIEAIYGGASMETQLKNLRKGVDIVVGTPGRVIDHLERGSLKIENISYFVLDEADEMLNMGFIEDIELILSKTPTDKRMLLFSATMPDRIQQLARNFMREYEVLAVKKRQMTTHLVDQIYYEVSMSDRLEALCRIIDIQDEFYGMIFCRTKSDTDELVSKLIERGYNAEGLHGDVSQHQRERILDKFKKQVINILVATDVAARGIDVQSLTHVINYALPQDPESYVHRIGRTGRAGRKGTAVSIVTASEARKLDFIRRISKADIRREQLPNVQEVIRIKRDKIHRQLTQTSAESLNPNYRTLAEELLMYQDPAQLVAALLKRAYHNDLDESTYREIRSFGEKSRKDAGYTRNERNDRGGDHPRNERSERNQRFPRERTENDGEFLKSGAGRKGKTRLFVALGRKDGATPRKLVDLFERDANVFSRNIDDIQVLDTYSFVTVPTSQVDKVMQIFNKKNARAMVELAGERS